MIEIELDKFVEILDRFILDTHKLKKTDFKNKVVFTLDGKKINTVDVHVGTDKRDGSLALVFDIISNKK